MNTVSTPTPNAWYREPWPWLLMAGPAIVVVAGFVTLWLAIQSADGLVADDYYKQGKAINMTLTRDARARELGYVARVTIAADGDASLAFAEASPAARELRLSLHHPTRGGQDRTLVLRRASDGTYRAAFPAMEIARWRLTLEDDSRAWRLTGDWIAGSGSIALGTKP